jgi:hypothetical protein
MAVWIMQVLCPERHCIAASCALADTEADAREKLDASTRQTMAELIAGDFNPWCGLCGAKQETWRYELGRTRFGTIAEAQPALREEERKQAITRDLFGGAGSR